MPSVHYISRKLLKKNGLECLPWDVGTVPTQQQLQQIDAPTDLQLQQQTVQHLGEEDKQYIIHELEHELSTTIDSSKKKLSSIVVGSSTAPQVSQPDRLDQEDSKSSKTSPTKPVEEDVGSKKKTKHLSPIALRALAALNSDSDSSSCEEEDMEIDKLAQKGLDAAEIAKSGGKDEVGEDTLSSGDKQIMIPSLPPLPVVPPSGYNVADDTAQLDQVYSLSDKEEDAKSTKEPAKKRRRDNSGDKKKRTRVSFQQRLDELKAYKDEHGHTNVKKSEDKSLNEFCNNIRYAHNHPDKSAMLMNEERIASLNALGFEWTVKEKVAISFEQRLEDLKTYKKKHGHLNLKREDNPSLYNFCVNTRYARNKADGRMAVNRERILSLDAIGFDWSEQKTQKTSFQQRLDELKAYKLEHGHINVKRDDDPSLYNFCNNMKAARNNPSGTRGKVSEERIASLGAIGFDWGNKPAEKRKPALDASGDKKKRTRVSFQQRIDELKAYKKKHGHLNVKREDDPSLHDFCQNIRYAYNHPDKTAMIMNEERIASLTAVGFEWAAKENKRTSFQQRLEDLKAYKLKHGHLNVRKEEDPSLYNFCNSMKTARNNPSGTRVNVSEERIASLDVIGFNWGKKKSSGKEELVRNLMMLS